MIERLDDQRVGRRLDTEFRLLVLLLLLLLLLLSPLLLVRGMTSPKWENVVFLQSK